MMAAYRMGAQGWTAEQAMNRDAFLRLHPCASSDVSGAAGYEKSFPERLEASRNQPRADAAHLNCPESAYEVHVVSRGGGSCWSHGLRRRSRKLDEYPVSPQSATTTSNPQGQVGYTATGNFANGKSRELSQVDGLSWKTSPTSTGTAAATIGSTGEATCSAPGNVTVTASAPENLVLHSIIHGELHVNKITLRSAPVGAMSLLH